MVPASYLVPPTPTSYVLAQYSYEPALGADGVTPENVEELAINEGERLALFSDEGDWCLVARIDNGAKGAGYVPSSYVEVRPQLRRTR